MNLVALIEDTITSIIKANPSQYDQSVYTSPQKKFKIIEDALMQLGVLNCISIRHADKALKNGKWRYVYEYQVEFNGSVVKGYNNRNSAKYRVVKEYLKIKANGKKEAKNN